MYINQSPFNFNDLIVSTSTTGPFQQNGTTATGYSILPANNNCTAANASYQQANKSANGYCFAQQQSVNSNLSNNRSTSVSSTGSTSSISSNASTNSSCNSTSTASSSSSPSNMSYNKLTNNNYNPYNFAYYNPTLAPTNTSTSTTTTTQYSAASNPLKTNPFVSGTQLLQNATAINGITASGLGAINTTSSLNSYSTLNDKFLYRPKSDIYQLNVLPQKSSQFQYGSPQTTASIVNNDSNSLLLSALKTAQAKPNYYNSHFEPTIAYLPTSTDLFFTTNPGVDQTAFSTSYLAPSFAYATSAPAAGLGQQQQLAHSKPLIHSVAPFAAATAINIKKRKRRFKKPLELRKVLPKNSLMLLHEYRPNVEYRFVCQSGPIHRPIFTMCVEINEHKFEGEGKTKKEARMAAAEKAIEFLLQNPEYIQKPVNHSTSSSLSSPTLCAAADQDSANIKNDLSDDEDNENENEHRNNDLDDDDDDDNDEMTEEKTKRFKSKETSQSLNDQTNLKCEQFQTETVST